MPIVGNPIRREFASPEQLNQVHCVAPVGLDAVAGLRWDERNRHYNAVVAKALDQTVEAVACRACLVVKVSRAIRPRASLRAYGVAASVLSISP
jgi:hypothetical protein